MKVIILAGGSGTRLWPLSRLYYPKQFNQIFDGKSLFQLTLDRNDGNQFLIVTNEHQYFLVEDQGRESGIPKLPFILEPVGRNTAPAITLACMACDPQDVVLVTPCDHMVRDIAAYQDALKKAEKLAQEGYLVTFGIRPSYAATGYGYIQAQGEDVEAFKEKPDQATAESYLQSGNYFWNSGMFVFKAETFLQELETYHSDILSASNAAYHQAVCDDDGRIRRIKVKDMSAIPSISIDYAVMEKSKCVKVVPVEMGWSDLGSFDELQSFLPQDENGNAVLANYLGLDSKNNLIISRTNKKIATIGVEDIIVVDTADALLVSTRGHAQQVKQIVQTLKDQGSTLVDAHLTVHRPWGSYSILLEEPGQYKIKKIVVKPKQKLSLQKHFHRNEHWIVVSGTARIRNGEDNFDLNENESTFIPMGSLHRLENPGKIELVMIEAQVGKYLEEDDIVRVDDEYHRS